MRREDTVRASGPLGPSSSARVSDDPDIPEGVHAVHERIGRYELCFHLAAGGMATVYLARLDGPDGFEKLVALKTIHPHLARDRRFVDMFLDEARIASRISHGNVCQIFEYGEADGTWFIAMEYLVGECFATLYNRCLRRPEVRVQPRARVTLLAMLAEACEGLHAAHELVDARGKPLGVVHRDVSHHNVFVTYDGAVKVVDFGIATATDRRHRTATGEVKGKFAYMSPEQARANKVDRTADVWAVGVMAWELLTGRRLFARRTDSATLLAVSVDEIPPPSRHDPTISPALDAVVLRALARTPAERWTTARDLGLALIAASGAQRGSVGRPEIASLMSELFPDGRVARERLADLARSATADTTEISAELATTLVGLAPSLMWEPTPVTDIRDVRAADADDRDDLPPAGEHDASLFAAASRSRTREIQAPPVPAALDASPVAGELPPAPPAKLAALAAIGGLGLAATVGVVIALSLAPGPDDTSRSAVLPPIPVTPTIPSTPSAPLPPPSTATQPTPTSAPDRRRDGTAAHHVGAPEHCEHVVERHARCRASPRACAGRARGGHARHVGIRDDRRPCAPDALSALTAARPPRRERRARGPRYGAAAGGHDSAGASDAPGDLRVERPP